MSAQPLIVSSCAPLYQCINSPCLPLSLWDYCLLSMLLPGHRWGHLDAISSLVLVLLLVLLYLLCLVFLLRLPVLVFVNSRKYPSQPHAKSESSAYGSCLHASALTTCRRVDQQLLSYKSLNFLNNQFS